MYELKKCYIEELTSAITSTVGFPKLFDSTVLVTGATGLIGGFIVDMLLKAIESGSNARVYALGRNENSLQNRFAYDHSGHLHFLIQDVCEEINIRENIDYIIHAAGDGFPKAFRVRPVETMEATILGAINTLNVAKKCNSKGYVLVSSGEVYGESSGFPFSEKERISAEGMSPRSCYPVGKQAAEILCVSYMNEFGVNANVARLSHVYGAYTSVNDNRASIQFLQMASKGNDITLYSKGDQVRSYTYVADAASAILSILLSGKSGEAYNVSNSESISSVAEFAETVSKCANVNCRYVVANEEQLLERTPISYAVLDSSKLQKLGWEARYHLIEGITCSLNDISN